MKDWTTHFELDAYGERVEVFVPMETVEEHQYSGEQAAKRRARKAAWASINWRNVEALPVWEQWSNEPGYSESLYPFYH